MATKAKKKDEEKAQPRITLETVKTVFIRALENPLRGVPTLIGPSQWGKTHWGREWLAEMLGATAQIVMINPQTDLPEDVAGWPVREGRELSFTNPSGIPPQLLSARSRKRWALFLDEVDKAKEDTLSALLTLLNPGERRLRHTVIPPEVPICVAMNEPRRELPEPLIARLLFIPFPPEQFEMERIACSSLLSPPTVTVPKRPHAPGSYYKLREWYSVPEFASDEAVRLAVISGLFPKEVIPAILESMNDRVNRSEHWAEQCTVPDMVQNMFLVAGMAPTREEATAIFNALRVRAQEDATNEVANALLGALKEEVAARWEWKETPDVNALREIGNALTKKYKEGSLSIMQEA